MSVRKDAYYGTLTRRPPRPEFHGKNIPRSLRDMPRWIGWRFAWKKKDEKWSKLPLDPNTLCRRLAKTNTPETWATFRATLAAAGDAWLSDSGAVDGLGFVFHADGVFGLDIDDCRDPETGELSDLATRLLRQFATYAEISPSGLGVKLIGRGSLPAGWKGRKQKVPGRPEDVEVYDRGRYFTLTGQVVPGSPQEVNDCSAALASFLAEFFPTPSATVDTAEREGGRDSGRDGDLSDDEVIDRITRTAKNAAKGNRLWRGDTSDHGGDDSAADQALCNLIAFYTGPDSDRIDRIFRRSGLVREKWTGRADYRAATIGKALAGRTKFYSRNGQAEPARRAAAGGSAATTFVVPPGGYPLTDYGNAQRLTARHGKDIRYVLKHWIVWNGRRWVEDRTQRVIRLAKDTTRAILADIPKDAEPKTREAYYRHAMNSESGRAIREMVKLAESEPDIALEADDLDGDPFLFNCQNGTLDLRTGELRPHRREDMMTKISPVHYDPNATCENWERMLRQIFAKDSSDPDDPGDTDLIDFVRRLFGYSLTGDVREQVLPIFWGGGSNGKTSILNTVRQVMGKDYAVKAPRGLLMAHKTEAQPTELVVLFGARLAIATESKRGQRLSEDLVKDLTGDEAIPARRLYENLFEFEPTHKLILTTNHRPRIPESDDGIWRRVFLVPFKTKFWNPAKGETGPDHLRRDNGLKYKLIQEYPGILAWLVRGCLEWQRSGLGAPTAVQEETATYRSEEDQIAQFLSECCEVSNAAPNTLLKTVYAAYCKWCEDDGSRPMTRQNFSADLRGHNVVVKNGKGNKVMCYGLNLTACSGKGSTIEDFDD